MCGQYSCSAFGAPHDSLWLQLDKTLHTKCAPGVRQISRLKCNKKWSFHSLLLHGRTFAQSALPFGETVCVYSTYCVRGTLNKVV